MDIVRNRQKWRFLILTMRGARCFDVEQDMSRFALRVQCELLLLAALPEARDGVVGFEL